MKKILILFSALIIGIIAVLLFNTLTNTPTYGEKIKTLEELPTQSLEHLAEAIQIKTETPNDALQFDTVQFFKYRHFIETAYPTLHQQLPRNIVDSFNYIYYWKGTDTSLLPMVLMAHYDVVPVEASAIALWHAKPYGGEIKDGYLWGRGVLDDKSSMISILEASEQLLKKGYKPKQSLYLCFGADEESSGSGATAMVKYFKSKQIKFDLVVDEGGEISTEDIKEVKHPIATIGVGEKGYVTLILTAKKEGGHSSIPAKSTAIDILNAGLYHLRQTQMPATLIAPIKAYLNKVSTYNEDFWTKLTLSNLWLFESWVMNKLSEAPSTNALFRTTLVPTIINSGVRDNVIPTFATAYVNSRILPGQTQKDVYNFVKKTINDTNIKITIYDNYSTEASTTTDINSKGYKRIEKAIKAIVDSVVVAPVIMVGATDSRNYRTISKAVLNFTPITNGKGYHGIDERLLITDFQKEINFYTLLIKNENN